jgi:outer membrane protein OmpA-like peptidoglycan-associated protein
MKNLLLITLMLSLVSCATKDGEFDENRNTKKSAGIGAFVGAVAGAMLSKNKKTGLLIGGVVGAAAGGLYGKKLDKQARELNEIAETKRTDKGIITKLKGDITFKTGKSSVKQDANDRLKQMANILKKYPENRITIFGHTDSTGSASVNNRLSMQRADTVKEILVAQGVSKSSILTKGVGSKDPIASNNNNEGRAENRRVELAITMPEPKK